MESFHDNLQLYKNVNSGNNKIYNISTMTFTFIKLCNDRTIKTLYVNLHLLRLEQILHYKYSSVKNITIFISEKEEIL